jgi:hypothetical protein
MQSTVEAELQRLQQGASSYPEGLRQLAAIRYYLQEVLSVTGEKWQKETQHVSNYLTLVDRIKRWKPPNERVCFVTFNYDLLLDFALKTAGYPFAELSAYIARDVMLVKLHGSVIWGRKVATPLQRDILQLQRASLAQHLIENYAELEISQDYALIGEAPPAPRNDQAVFPALAIPVETKLAFECPPEHITALKAFIPEVRKILIVGWRATEQPFLELLKEGLGHANPIIMAVNGPQAESDRALENIARAGIRGRGRKPPQSEYGFTDFIRSHGENQFLNSA